MSGSTKLLTVAQLAERWGPAWSIDTIYRLCHAKAIPFVRIGPGRGRIYFEEATLDAWLAQRRVTPKGDGSAPARYVVDDRLNDFS